MPRSFFFEFAGRSRSIPVRRLILPSLVAIPLSVGVAFFAAANEGCSDDPPNPGAPPIIIGATVDLSQQQRDFGEGVQRVLRVAEQQINAVGGILGRRVVLDIASDEGTPSVAAGLTTQFIGKKISGFVGPSSTDTLETMQGAFRGAQIPIISPVTTSPKVLTFQPDADRYLFRTACATEYQGRALARYALHGSFLPPNVVPPPIDAGVTDAAGLDAAVVDAGSDADASVVDAGTPTAFKACTKMAVLYVEDSPGAGSATINAFKDEFVTKYGGSVKELVLTAGSSSYTTAVGNVLDAARAGEVQCQLALLGASNGGAYMRNFGDATKGFPEFSIEKFPTYGFIRFYQQGFIEAGRVVAKDVSEQSATEGVIGAACNQERTSSPEWARFRALYDSQYPPTAASAGAPAPIPQVYDSVILLALAIEQAKSVDNKKAIRDALYTVSSGGTSYGPGQLAEALAAIRRGEDIDYNGASGTFDIDDKGDTLLDVILFKITGNQFVTVPGLQSGDLRQ